MIEVGKKILFEGHVAAFNSAPESLFLSHVAEKNDLSSMGIIREPKGVDFTVEPWEPTPDELKSLSAFIVQEKLRITKLKKRREKAAAKRAAEKAANSDPEYSDKFG